MEAKSATGCQPAFNRSNSLPMIDKTPKHVSESAPHKSAPSITVPTQIGVPKKAESPAPRNAAPCAESPNSHVLVPMHPPVYINLDLDGPSPPYPHAVKTLLTGVLNVAATPYLMAAGAPPALTLATAFAGVAGVTGGLIASSKNLEAELRGN
jgi:hypothetical protein